MNDNILCLYYSRTGNTKKAMEEVAEALDCECLEIRDKVDRSGTMGYLRCCFDAMHKRTSAVSRPKCQKPLSDYKDVFRQMDLYLQTPHVAEVSLCPDSAGYHFWRDQFVKACSDFIAEDKA